jgi:hypothetical protein
VLIYVNKSSGLGLGGGGGDSGRLLFGAAGNCTEGDFLTSSATVSLSGTTWIHVVVDEK